MRRQTFASKLLGNLEDWVAEIRESMGSGTADDYSDIDICWVVPDDSFTEAVDTPRRRPEPRSRRAVAWHRS